MIRKARDAGRSYSTMRQVHYAGRERNAASAQFECNPQNPCAAMWDLIRGSQGNIVVGIVGAVLGGYIFRFLGLYVSGMLGVLIMATVGAVALLFIIGIVKKA